MGAKKGRKEGEGEGRSGAGSRADGFHGVVFVEARTGPESFTAIAVTALLVTRDARIGNVTNHRGESVWL